MIHMTSNLSALLKSYHELPEMHRQVVDLLSVKFSGADSYETLRYLQKNISDKYPINKYQTVLKDLEKRARSYMTTTSIRWFTN